MATFDFGLALVGPKGQGSFTVKLGVEFGGGDDMGEAMKLTILSMNLLMKNMVCTVADKQSPLVCYRTKNFFLHKTDFRFGFAASQKA